MFMFWSKTKLMQDIVKANKHEKPIIAFIYGMGISLTFVNP